MALQPSARVPPLFPPSSRSKTSTRPGRDALRLANDRIRNRRVARDVATSSLKRIYLIPERAVKRKAIGRERSLG